MEINLFLVHKFFKKYMSNFYALTSLMRLYDACGNIIGIAPLSQVNYHGDFRNDFALRTFLLEWGQKNNCDSIMVLTGDPRLRKSQGYHVKMYVFEPKGNDSSRLPGGVSTMCGNGVRAVAHFIGQVVDNTDTLEIMTGSGLRNISIQGNNFYQVNMGKFFSQASALSRYINTKKVQSRNGYFIDSPIPEDIRKLISKYVSVANWSIGLNGDIDSNGNIDGEPHVVLFLDQNIKDIFYLRRVAMQIGPLITKNLELFPYEINANFVVNSRKNKDSISVLLCTHERNLGSNPQHSVTAACGTGSTAVGALISKKYKLTDKQMVNVFSPGGKLMISKRKENLFMTGSVVSLV